MFLAEVTGGLELREQVRRYLEQARSGCPARRHLEGQVFRDALEQALGQSTLFIQLLGEFPGRRHRTSLRAMPACNWNAPRLASSPFCSGTIQR